MPILVIFAFEASCVPPNENTSTAESDARIANTSMISRSVKPLSLRREFIDYFLSLFHTTPLEAAGSLSGSRMARSVISVPYCNAFIIVNIG
jgi:hypothetical protein